MRRHGLGLAALDDLVDSYWLCPIVIGLAADLAASYTAAVADTFYC